MQLLQHLLKARVLIPLRLSPWIPLQSGCASQHTRSVWPESSLKHLGLQTTLSWHSHLAELYDSTQSTPHVQVCKSIWTCWKSFFSSSPLHHFYHRLDQLPPVEAAAQALVEIVGRPDSLCVIIHTDHSNRRWSIHVQWRRRGQIMW